MRRQAVGRRLAGMASSGLVIGPVASRVRGLVDAVLKDEPSDGAMVSAHRDACLLA
jgi:hypothetical protein